MRNAVAIALLLLSGCSAPPAKEPANQAATAAPPARTSIAAPAAAAKAPPSAPRTGPWSASGYALNGTEPFWGGTVTGTRVRYMIPEDQFGTEVETAASYPADRETYSGSLRGRPFVLTLRQSPCSDGMSDHSYAFAASLEVGGETRRGCADPQ
jgi:uncharacterized membrane protein